MLTKASCFDRLLNRLSRTETKSPYQVELAVTQTLPKHIAPYYEENPTIKEWLSSFTPTRDSSIKYLRSLFPFAIWIQRYNLHWLLGDAIAGLTVGFVVVPQAMAYALLAGLSPEYGLYTSFMGAALYWLFGTSKDVVIGTTAVGSLLVGEVITRVQTKRPDEYTAEEIAKAISLLSGLVLLVLGSCRLGWLIELIPYISISAFVTSASFTIIGTQLPVALGITGVQTREAPYKVYIGVLQRLRETRLDAAIGLTSIALLFTLSSGFAYLETRRPNRKGLWTTLGSLRMTFTILLYTLVSWLVHRRLPRGEHVFRLVGHINAGFSHAGVPEISKELFGFVAPSLPSMIIILIIEHVAIAKSFSRQFGYEVDSSQEILAQGSSNALGVFVGGYACTGSFGASAVLSKAGAKTPLASLFSAGILLLALYALTKVFYYIPMAALAGLIIHAVFNLMTPPSVLYRYWRLSPFELLIWVTGVVVAIFLKLEASIYTTVALSFILLLVRMAKSRGSFLRQVSTHQISHWPEGSDSRSDQQSRTQMQADAPKADRMVYLPPGAGAALSEAQTEMPYPGIFIYRFNEAYNYINKGQHMAYMVSHIKARTRRTTEQDETLLKDRLWSVPPPSLPSPDVVEQPILRAIVLDCSTINNLDIASIQGLEDARKSLESHAVPATVEWHFAGLHNPWARRALVEAGFGRFAQNSDSKWGHIYSVVRSVSTRVDQRSANTRDCALQTHDVGQDSIRVTSSSLAEDAGAQPLYGRDRPYFHVDIIDAVDAAVQLAKQKDWFSP